MLFWKKNKVKKKNEESIGSEVEKVMILHDDGKHLVSNKELIVLMDDLSVTTATYGIIHSQYNARLFEILN